MTELLTAAQMRAIEQAAIASGEVTGLELMERAGEGVVEAIFEEWPELGEGERRAVVLCGPGNNGGDGFVVARLLKEQGWQVEVFLYGDPEKLPPDARVNYERWEGKTTIRRVDPPPLLDDNFSIKDLPDVMVDSFFGTGLSRNMCGIAGGIALAIRVLRKTKSIPIFPIVAVDLPSGICSDSGAVLGDAYKADLTVTFHSAKLGHHLAEGPDRCGKLIVKDIGLSEWNHHKNDV